MIEKILKLSKKLILIKSTSENQKALDEILKLSLFELKEYPKKIFKSKGVKSALIFNKKGNFKKFKIILNGHLDVIPGKENQYKPVIKGNKLYGVGSADMKASVSCLIFAFKEVAKKVNYPLALQLVTDEEVGGFNGTKYQIEKGIRSDFVIVGESTNFNIENKAKGILWLKIFAKGKTGHSARPWMGENAILKMNTFLQKLKEKYPWPKKENWVTTFNISSIKTNNEAFNKIPDYCEVWCDVRYIPEEKNQILKNLKKLLPKGFILKTLVNEPPFYVSEKNPYVKLLVKLIKRETKKGGKLIGGHGSSDARHFTRVSCPAVEFGPIYGGIGSDNEWVEIPSLEKYFQILKDFLLSLR
jgi:succinyl-diaminopimelate desuccinylase